MGALVLPAGSTIVLAEGSDNHIESSWSVGIVASGDLTITGKGNLDIVSYYDGINVRGNLAVEEVGVLNISAGFAGNGYFDASGILAGGNFSLRIATEEPAADDTACMLLKNVDEININSTGDGIAAFGNLIIDNVGIIDIQSHDGMGILSFTLDMINSGDISISSSIEGIEAASYVNIEQCVSLYIKSAGEAGIRSFGETVERPALAAIEEDASSGSEGVVIRDCQDVSIEAYVGIESADNLSLINIDNLVVDARFAGIGAGSLERYLYSEPVLQIQDAEQDELVYFIDLKNIGQGSINASHIGVLSIGPLSIENCSDLNVDATRSPLDEKRAINQVADGEYEIMASKVSEPLPLAISVLDGDLTIKDSNVSAAGYSFGLATGWPVIHSPEKFAVSDIFPGGDIIIIRSRVTASADADEGYAAIFAGDNVEPGADGHARIIIDESSVVTPNAGRIVDVLIEAADIDVGDVSCQSITDEDIELITDWAQVANYVEIYISTYSVAYDANGGSGTMTDENSPYQNGETVTVPENTFTYDGYLFTGWNTAADGSGTAYEPGDTFAAAEDIVLYAQYEEIIIETFTVTYDANGGSGTMTDENSPYNLEETVTVLDNEFALEGHSFTGWNTAADGSGTAYEPGDTFVISGDLLLFAQYTEDIVPIPKTGQKSGVLYSGILLLAAVLLYSVRRKKFYKQNI